MLTERNKALRSHTYTGPKPRTINNHWLMKLKKGITGFWDIKDELIKPGFSVSRFKDSLYPLEYTGSKSYKVIGFKEETGPRSYHRLSLFDTSRKQNLDILINSTYPYYCGVMSDSLNEFIDLPPEIITCADPAFEYLDSGKLNSRFTESDLLELSEYELKEIKYWRIQTFGEIIFNFWD